MTQQQFADALRIPVKTLQNCKQNRVAMDPSAISLMIVLAREPEAALRALSKAGRIANWQLRRPASAAKSVD